MKDMYRNPAMKYKTRRTVFWQRRLNVKGLYILLFFPLVYIVIFNYVPIYGIIMAFKRFAPRDGIWGSPWAGFYNFRRLFDSPNFLLIMRNTLTLSLYSLFAGFPFPLILAICINHSYHYRFKKITQTITFAPYFLSSVIVVGLIVQVLDMRIGVINLLLQFFGIGPVNFMGSASLFPHVYVWSGIWQGTGYSAIIYISALASVDPTYHEAAIIDGANLWQRIWHIDLSTIRPIVVIMLILSMGHILGGNFEKTYLMQNPLNISTSEIINTYVYKVGLTASRPDYSFGTAIGLFQNVVGVIMTLTVNKIADKISGEGMF
jgi:multiple sugar transport system permease protein/putative aldouronate transport system permease protein